MSVGQSEKIKLLIYLNAEDARELRRERADTRQPVSTIIGRIVRDYLESKSRPKANRKAN